MTLVLSQGISPAAVPLLDVPDVAAAGGKYMYPAELPGVTTTGAAWLAPAPRKPADKNTEASTALAGKPRNPFA